jgi:hypothetical protein
MTALPGLVKGNKLTTPVKPAGFYRSSYYLPPAAAARSRSALPSGHLGPIKPEFDTDV